MKNFRDFQKSDFIIKKSKSQNISKVLLLQKHDPLRFSEIRRNFLPDLSDRFFKLRCAILTCAPLLGVPTLKTPEVLGSLPVELNKYFEHLIITWEDQYS